MDSLTADELRSRLSFDYQTVMLMSCPLMEVEAYRNIDDLKAQRNQITSPTEGHLAVHYRVKYNIKTLIGPGRYSPSTTVRFDLFGDNNYPESEPPCFVIDSQVPWSPHFYKEYAVCTGTLWEEADGNILLGELMVHVAKLLNFDEPVSDEVESGYQPEATKYWMNELGLKPITKLVYPQLPQRLPPAPVETVFPAPEASVFVKKQITESSSTESAPAIAIRPSAPETIRPTRIKFRQS